MERMTPDTTDFNSLSKKQLVELVIAKYNDCFRLEEENKKLREDNRFLTKISKEYMEKENIVEVAEFTELYKDELEEENKKLKERINTMQEFIDYSGGVVQNAIGMLYEEGGEDKALDYLENCYVIGDEGLYEEMEKIYENED